MPKPALASALGSLSTSPRLSDRPDGHRDDQGALDPAPSAENPDQPDLTILGAVP
jgi:hypothetical protein